MLPCGHIFHYRCLRSWFEQSHSCPICRASLAEPARPARGRSAGRDERADGANDRGSAGTALRALRGEGGEGEGGGGGGGGGDGGGGGGVWRDAGLYPRDEGESEEEGEEEGEGEEGEGEEAEQSYLLFSSENWRWPSWMPGLYLEVIRRHSSAGWNETAEDSVATTQEELFQLREVFPQLPEQALRRALLREATLEDAIESLLQELEH